MTVEDRKNMYEKNGQFYKVARVTVHRLANGNKLVSMFDEFDNLIEKKEVEKRFVERNPPTKPVEKPYGWIRFPGLMGPIFLPANRIDCITPYKSSGFVNSVLNFLGLTNSHKEDKKMCRIFTTGDSLVSNKHQTSLVVRLSPQQASQKLSRFFAKINRDVVDAHKRVSVAFNRKLRQMKKKEDEKRQSD